MEYPYYGTARNLVWDTLVFFFVHCNVLIALLLLLYTLAT